MIVVRVEPLGSGQRSQANAPILDRTYRDLLTRVGSLPGVRSVSLGRSSPLAGSSLGFAIVAPAGGAPIRLASTIVYPRFFETIGVPIVKGPDFAEDDLRAGAPRVVVVNEAFVREVLGGREPLGTGHGLSVPGPRRQPQGSPAAIPRGEPLDIVGVVRDERFPGLREAAPPIVYQTFLQANTGFGQMVLHVRASREDADILRPVTDLVRAIERNVPLATVHTLADEVNAALARERLVATLAGISVSWRSP